MSVPNNKPLNALAFDSDAWLQMKAERAQADRAAAYAAGVHLGSEATDRAYELIAWGLEYEKGLRREYFRAREKAEIRNPRGRPSTPISRDQERATMLLNMSRAGYTSGTVLNQIRRLAASERHYVASGEFPREDCLFVDCAESTLQKSVSTGLAQLGLTAKALTK